MSKKDANSPGFEYMPDMYCLPSVEYYMGTHVINGDTLDNAMLPVAGTIARGYMPYVYPNTAAGYEAVAWILKIPPYSAEVEKEGEVIYGCSAFIVMGLQVKRDGPRCNYLVLPFITSIKKILPEGKFSHSIAYEPSHVPRKVN